MNPKSSARAQTLLMNLDHLHAWVLYFIFLVLAHLPTLSPTHPLHHIFSFSQPLHIRLVLGSSGLQHGCTHGSIAQMRAGLPEKPVTGEAVKKAALKHILQQFTCEFALQPNYSHVLILTFTFCSDFCHAPFAIHFSL